MESQVDLGGSLLDIIEALCCHSVKTSTFSADLDTCADAKIIQDKLVIEPHSWYENGDRCLFVRLPTGMWLDHTRKRSVEQLAIRIGKTNLNSVEENDLTEGVVALLFNDRETQYFQIPKENVLSLEQNVGSALGNVSDSEKDSIVCEVYVPPYSKAHHRKDAWWSSKYLKLKGRCKPIPVNSSTSTGGSSKSKAYQHYRETIDNLIIDAVKAHLIRGKQLQVAELCAGDGSLALKLLDETDLEFQKYIMFERNELLTKESIKKTSLYRDKVECINLDVCSLEGEMKISGLEPRRDVWLASGSVLCGQVGEYTMAQGVLNAMAKSLSSCGIIVVTGFTQSFLNPKMIYDAGLRVVHASLPTLETSNLESGFKRFHLFVLRKVTDSSYCLPELKQKFLKK